MLNLTNLILQNSYIIIMALGMLLVIVAGHIDLSVGSVVGFIGALVGMWLQRQTGLPEIFTIDVDGNKFPIVWSIIGGVLFAVVVGLLTRPTRRVVYE